MRRVSRAQLLSSSQTVNMPSQSIVSKFITPFGAERKIKYDVFQYNDDGKISDVYVAIRTYGKDKEFVCLTQREMHRLHEEYLKVLGVGAFGFPKREILFRKRYNGYAIEVRKDGNKQRLTLNADEVKLIVDADIPKHFSLDVVD